MRHILAARVVFAIFSLLTFIAPRDAAAEYWCQKEDRNVLGVLPDGSIVVMTQSPSGGADCDTVTLQLLDKSGAGKPLLEITSGAMTSCDRLKVTRGKLVLTKAEQKLGLEKISNKVAKSLGATPLVPSKRTDFFTVQTTSEFDDRVAETNTRAFVRWDGEPVISMLLGNYLMGAGQVRLLEHPSSPGLFVEFSSVDLAESKTSECGVVHYTFYISPADIAAHAQLVESRAQAAKSPELALVALRERIRAGLRDPLLAHRLARTEIAAGKKKGKPDSCQTRTRKPLGMTEAGALVFTARITLPPGRPCTTEERVVVEDAAGKTLLRVERRLPDQCDANARGWKVYEGAATLPADKIATAADLDAVTAIVAARHSYTTLTPIAGASAPYIEAGRDGVKFVDGEDVLVRQKWRTTSPAAAYRVQRLGHARSRNQVLRYASLPPWRWSAGGVCEDEVEDFAILTASRQAELVAVAAIRNAENMAAAATLLQKHLDVKAARDTFLELAAKNSICNDRLAPLYKAIKARKSAELQAFAAELCTRNRDDDCHELDEPCGQTTE